MVATEPLFPRLLSIVALGSLKLAVGEFKVEKSQNSTEKGFFFFLVGECVVEYLRAHLLISIILIAMA